MFWRILFFKFMWQSSFKTIFKVFFWFMVVTITAGALSVYSSNKTAEHNDYCTHTYPDDTDKRMACYDNK